MIETIQLRNVRRFPKAQWQIHSRNVIISGLNATGKTTILEAIYAAALTKSHRTNNLKEMIQENQEFADIQIETDSNTYHIVISKEGKMVSINHHEVSKVSEYIGQFPAVFFSPYDLSIITDSPSVRRQFLNREISQIYPDYIRNLSLFNKFLQERNACLKSLDIDSDTKILDVLTEQMLVVAKKIMMERASFIDEINQEINNVHSALCAKEQIKLQYSPNVPISQLETVFANKKMTDIVSHQTNYGPQRDDIVFLMNDKNVSKFGSQGQIRSFVLSLKISLCKIIYKYKKNYPVLLLDDVLSELDVERQNRLLQIVNQLGQTFISTVDTSVVNKRILEKYQLIQL